MDMGRLAAWLSEAAGAPVVILAHARLSGGAIQQNIALSVTCGGVAEAWVLRTDNAATLAVSLGRGAEFALLQAAHAAGVMVAEPLFGCEDRSVIGAPFFVMRRVSGSAAGHAAAKRAAAMGGDAALAAEHGRQMARIHRIRPPRADLGFLGEPPADATAAFIARMRGRLDEAGTPRPALEYGLRMMERQAPAPLPAVLCHNDFRTGNTMQDAGRITAVLDWEFAAWGDPLRIWAGSPRAAGALARIILRLAASALWRRFSAAMWPRPAGSLTRGGCASGSLAPPFAGR